MQNISSLLFYVVVGIMSIFFIGLLLLMIFSVLHALIRAWMRDIDLDDPEQRAWVRNYLKKHYPNED